MISEDNRGIGLSRRGIHTAAFALSEETDEMFENETFVHNYNGVIGENIKKILRLKEQKLIVTDKSKGRYCRLEDARYKGTGDNITGRGTVQKNQIRLGRYFKLTDDGVSSVLERRDKLSDESKYKLSLIINKLISSPKCFIRKSNKEFKVDVRT